MKYYVRSDYDFLLKGAFKELAIAEEPKLKEGGGSPKGEGSRGGKIIGHTKSGKPVYGKAGSPQHKGFSKKEHLEAAVLHREQIEKKSGQMMDLGNHDGTISHKDIKMRDKLQREISDHRLQRDRHVEKHSPSERQPDQRDYDRADKKNDPNKRSRAWGRSELDETYDLIKGFKEKLPGGLAAGKKPKDFDAKKLKEGAKVESEHTGDKNTQKEIAMDHLVEDKKYYKKLKQIEG